MKKIFIAISLLLSLTLTSANAVEVSQEAKITGLYVAFFNRAADQKGLDYWTNKAVEVAKQGGDVSSVFKTLSKGFATHPTFTSTYGDLNNQEFVAAIYRNALGRDGDAEGIAYWTDLLDRGMIRSDMVATFVELSMVTDLTPANYPTLSATELAAAQLRQDLITNKVTVALAFTHQLGTLSNVVDSDKPGSDPAYLASIKIISEVTEDAKTVSDAIAFLDSIKENDDPIWDIIVIVSYLIDSPISGITYVCGNKTGVTDIQGRFECLTLPVTFRIGSLVIGQLDYFTADKKVYPQDLLNLPRDNFTDSKLIALVRLLQSLDNDGNITQVINIPQEKAEKFVDPETFDESKLDEYAGIAGVELVSAEDAIIHLKESLNVEDSTHIDTTAYNSSTSSVVSFDQSFIENLGNDDYYAMECSDQVNEFGNKEAHFDLLKKKFLEMNTLNNMIYTARNNVFITTIKRDNHPDISQVYYIHEDSSFLEPEAAIVIVDTYINNVLMEKDPLAEFSDAEYWYHVGSGIPGSSESNPRGGPNWKDIDAIHDIWYTYQGGNIWTEMEHNIPGSCSETHVYLDVLDVIQEEIDRRAEGEDSPPYQLTGTH